MTWKNNRGSRKAVIEPYMQKKARKGFCTSAFATTGKRPAGDSKILITRKTSAKFAGAILEPPSDGSVTAEAPPSNEAISTRPSIMVIEAGIMKIAAAAIR